MYIYTCIYIGICVTITFTVFCIDRIDWGLVLERNELVGFFEDTTSEILESSNEEETKLEHISTDVFISCIIQCSFVMGIIQGSVVKHI